MRDSTADHPCGPGLSRLQIADFTSRLLYRLAGYASEKTYGLEGADRHQRVMLLAEWQRVERAVEIVAMLRIELAMQDQVAEGAARDPDAVRSLLEKLDVGRRAFQHRDEPQQRDRMHMPDPVILRSGKSGGGG